MQSAETATSGSPDPTPAAEESQAPSLAAPGPQGSAEQPEDFHDGPAVETSLNNVGRRPVPENDLVVGLVGAVGTDLPWVVQTLKTHLSSLGYETHAISLSRLIDSEYGDLPPRDSLSYDAYVTQRMSAGNTLRQHWGEPGAVAKLAVEEIRRRRDAYERAPACAFILRSLKRPEEVALLRTVYRGQFVLIGCHTPRPVRIRQLADEIARSRGSSGVASHRASAEALADRDEHELGQVTEPLERRASLKDFGQSVESTFPLADAYVSLQDLNLAQRAIERFCDLLLGAPYISPSRDEVAMFHARAAAVRSADLSRQVGAAIATRGGDIIAIGCNEVPRAGGGAYWEGDPDDARDFRKGFDGNHDQRNRALREVYDVLSARGLLSATAVGGGAQEFVNSLEDTRVDGLIEFTRSTHAEMAALLDAARRGTSVERATLYTSTFPCHNCAKHIVTAGIERVVFIEPYPKSLAEQLHGDALAVDDPCPQGRTVNFEHFTGIAPENYFPLFEAAGKRKRNDGRALQFPDGQIRPKLRANFRADILPFETATIEELRAHRDELGSPTRRMLLDDPGDDPSSAVRSSAETDY